jgi:hypothetical protein
LAEGERAHPTNYRGCRHAKEEMQKKKSQGTPRNTTGRMLSSKLVKTNLSFAATLRPNGSKDAPGNCCKF